jgi:hypothetical protein
MRSTIGKFISRGLRDKYFPKSEIAESDLLSIQLFVNAVLSAKGVLLKHKKRFISKSLWDITNPVSKYKYLQRYRSKCVLEEQDESIELRHEHVFEKANMVERILATPASVRKELQKAVGCVVTKPEHDLLHRKSKGYDGWARYKHAGIKVYDMKQGKWIT